MNILVTGGARLSRFRICSQNCSPVGTNCVSWIVGYFGVSHLRSLRPGIELIREDIRRFSEDKKECEQACWKTWIASSLSPPFPTIHPLN